MDIKRISGFEIEMRKNKMDYDMLLYICKCDMMIESIICSYMICQMKYGMRIDT